MKLHNCKIGKRVTVYDRYRFAIPVEGTIIKVNEPSNGVEIQLTSTNNPMYPIGYSVWVDRRQVGVI